MRAEAEPRSQQWRLAHQLRPCRIDTTGLCTTMLTVPHRQPVEPRQARLSSKQGKRAVATGKSKVMEKTAENPSGGYERQRHRITQTISKFTLPLMIDIYHRFDGDLIAAIVLGEIGVRNVGAWLSDDGNDASAIEDQGRYSDVLRPCNALSIAESTGIPRETVRRRVEALIARGWVYRDARGHLYVHPCVAPEFDDLSNTTQQRLRETAAQLDSLLSKPLEGHESTGT